MAGGGQCERNGAAYVTIRTSEKNPHFSWSPVMPPKRRHALSLYKSRRPAAPQPERWALFHGYLWIRTMRSKESAHAILSTITAGASRRGVPYIRDGGCPEQFLAPGRCHPNNSAAGFTESVAAAAEPYRRSACENQTGTGNAPYASYLRAQGHS